MGGKDLAGLAALGALGYMMSKKNKDDTSGMDAEMADRANAVSRGRTDLVDTGMSEVEPGWETKERGAPGTSETVTPSASSMARVRNAVRGDSGITPTPLTKGTKEDYMSSKMASQQFPMTAAPKYEPSAPKSAAKVGKASQATAERKEKNPMTNESLSAAQAKWAKGDQNPPSALQRLMAGNDASKSPRVMSQRQKEQDYTGNYKRGGVVKMAKGGLTGSSASRRADGIAQRGKTKGTMVMCGGGYTKGKK